MVRKLVTQLFARRQEAAPQTVPLPGQVPNNAGGYFYAIDDWARLDRFLVLGSDGGTYYVSAARLTLDNAAAVVRCLAADGQRTVRRIVDISEAGRAPRNQAALLALALAASAEDAETRRAALQALPRVARTGTHVLTFASFVDALRGWGRGLRRGFAHWFTAMPAERLALQATKYGRRAGWALRDLLRLAHPLTDEAERRVLLDWMAHPDAPQAIVTARRAFPLVEGLYRAREATSARQVADAIARYSLPREAVPTEHLNDVRVWDALLVAMPTTAMIRGLGKMSAVGLLAPGSDAARHVASRLGETDQLRKARVHPIQLLAALKTYARGRGERGGLAWRPVGVIVDALDEAFHGAFAGVEPTGKRLLVGVDVSGSMHWGRCNGTSVLAPYEAGAALAMQYVRTEPHLHVVAFDTGVYTPALTPRQRLDDVARTFGQWGGGTNVALPVLHALERKLEVDAFVIVTDNETWAGDEHPDQALGRYRAKVNPEARIAVLAVTANQGAVVQEEDAGAFGVAGFDAAVPELVADFIRG